MAVDESQYLNSAIFRDIKMLMNVNYDSLNCFALILVGEPYLNNILEKPVHESLKQRITVHYNYQGLSAQETADYIYHKIDTAGGARSIIDDAAVNAIAVFCQGTPRLIDNLMIDALTLGAQLKKQSIDAETILAASNNQSLR